jgi:VIT1/CCC1 family predicted Fe2+/Mn2+ transporter
MGAGEYVSVRSQRELLEASRPGHAAAEALPFLDVDANELALVYRARGMTVEDAQARADQVLVSARPSLVEPGEAVDEHETIGSAMGAALASFCFFASGAALPVLPYLLGAEGWDAVAWSAGLVGVALLGTGAAVGVLSGASPGKRALRQLAIGYGAASATYVLGLAFGSTV